jgi:hypothetical protein
MHARRVFQRSASSSSVVGGSGSEPPGSNGSSGAGGGSGAPGTLAGESGGAGTLMSQHLPARTRFTRNEKSGAPVGGRGSSRTTRHQPRDKVRVARLPPILPLSGQSCEFPTGAGVPWCERRGGRVVRQGPAKPRTAVRIRSAPPRSASHLRPPGRRYQMRGPPSSLGQGMTAIFPAQARRRRIASPSRF